MSSVKNLCTVIPLITDIVNQFVRTAPLCNILKNSSNIHNIEVKKLLDVKVIERKREKSGENREAKTCSNLKFLHF